ncbi:polymorphic toxin type 25 domain-containing protein [Photorhabdus sp. CRCIA-P01]|uniref:polymorphic toxin type 25 domain-containing protein n=1 Tax=Photorhabdus sp. CRCIA-P01 TaxID=2019570 RepID=UPI000E59CD98|nr:polymorphic toxin type 25 domain-containing protein [Photorhabdus sp. CRCIA-P01]
MVNFAIECVVTDNNALGYGPGTFWGQIANSVSSDASLSFDLQRKGKSSDEISKAIKQSHKGPSWGVTYKVKPYAKGEAAFGFGAGYFYDANVDNSQFSINEGETLAVGGRLSGQIGIQFGPYLPGMIDTKRNNSLGFGLGLGNVGISYGKDGLGLNLGVGPAWGWSGISKKTEIENIDINGSSGTELYNYKFNKGGD